MFKCEICKKEIRFNQSVVEIHFGVCGKMLESEVIRFHYKCLKKKNKKKREK